MCGLPNVKKASISSPTNPRVYWRQNSIPPSPGWLPLPPMNVVCCYMMYLSEQDDDCRSERLRSCEKCRWAWCPTILPGILASRWTLPSPMRTTTSTPLICEIWPIHWLFTTIMSALSSPLRTAALVESSVQAVTIKLFVSGSLRLAAVAKCIAFSIVFTNRYHTKRMQRIFCVNFSADARFVLSGSDDTNIRIWKAQAAAPLCTALFMAFIHRQTYQAWRIQARLHGKPEEEILCFPRSSQDF